MLCSASTSERTSAFVEALPRVSSREDLAIARERDGVEQPINTRLGRARTTSQTCMRTIMGCNIEERSSIGEPRSQRLSATLSQRLLLPGALLVAISAE